MIEERVFIAGAGPVGLVAAANLVRRGVPVTVFEAGHHLSEESRASTFHPPTLDMLHTLGAVAPLIAQGLVAPQIQYRSRRHGLLAQFDLGAIADVTDHPYRVQCEQSKLTRILCGQLHDHSNFRVEFDSKVRGAEQAGSTISIAVECNGRLATRTARWLIGADGARSEVRRSLGIGFDGFTWPERFLVVSTAFDFHSAIADLVYVNYVADPERWCFLLRIPGLWRVIFPIRAHEGDAQALSPAFVQSLLGRVAFDVAHCEVAHAMLYNVHQRVAQTFRRGRAFLAGDAAHINNPLGGMGMNGGIHDAMNLTARLAEVWNGAAPDEELDRYDRQRRLITLEHIETQSIQNKRNLESAGTEFGDTLRAIAADRERSYGYLLNLSMITSLRRAEELG